MAFEGLSSKLQAALSKLTSRGRLSEKDVKDAMREVRMALLEADVQFQVARDFVARVSERAVGKSILESLTPGQQVIKIVHEELTALMGAEQSKLAVASKPPTVIMLAGLQGVGKTTLAAKLALHLRRQGKKPLLAACDIYRPAAIEQLRVLGKQIDVPVFERGTQDPAKTAKAAIAEAERMLYNTVIIDTAGRLHIDEALMDELKRVKAAVKPHEILLVVDTMTGQDAVNAAKAFADALDITGVVLAKLDSDVRGGAALSVRAVSGRPIKFASTGEKPADLEPFYPDRMASRILGMGDVLTLIEKAQSAFDEKQAVELESKMRGGGLTLEDFLEQFRQVRKMGSMRDVLAMLPGANKLGDIDVDDKQISRVEAIILSMTPQERRNPDVLNASRRKRIAAGSGTSVQEINRLIKQYEQSRQLFKQFSRPSKGGKRGRFKMPF